MQSNQQRSLGDLSKTVLDLDYIQSVADMLNNAMVVYFEKDSFVKLINEVMSEYFKVLEVITFSEVQKDEILRLIYDRNRIEIDNVDQIFRDDFIYSVVKIMQSLFHVSVVVLELNSESSKTKEEIDKFYSTCFKIRSLYEDMVLAVDKITAKYKEVSLRNRNKEGGETSSTLAIGILAAIVDLKKQEKYKNDPKKLKSRLTSTSISKPLVVGQYKIYHMNNKIFEEHDGIIKDISPRSLRRYITEYAEKPDLIAKLPPTER